MIKVCLHGEVAYLIATARVGKLQVWLYSFPLWHLDWRHRVFNLGFIMVELSK